MCVFFFLIQEFLTAFRTPTIFVLSLILLLRFTLPLLVVLPIGKAQQSCLFFFCFYFLLISLARCLLHLLRFVCLLAFSFSPHHPFSFEVSHQLVILCVISESQSLCVALLPASFAQITLPSRGLSLKCYLKRRAEEQGLFTAPSNYRLSRNRKSHHLKGQQPLPPPPPPPHDWAVAPVKTTLELIRELFAPPLRRSWMVHTHSRVFSPPPCPMWLSPFLPCPQTSSLSNCHPFARTACLSSCLEMKELINLI